MACSRAVVIAFKSLEEQPLGVGLICLRRAAQPEDYILNQDRCETDPRIDKSRIKF